MLSSALAQQQRPALKKETARPFTDEGLVYSEYKSFLLPSTALLCSSSGIACRPLQLVHPSHTVRLGGGREPVLPSLLLHLHPRDASAEIPKWLRLLTDLKHCFLYTKLLVGNWLDGLNYESALCCCVSSRAFTFGARMPFVCYSLQSTCLTRDGVWKQASLVIIPPFSPFHRAAKLTIRANAHPTSISTCYKETENMNLIFSILQT